MALPKLALLGVLVALAVATAFPMNAEEELLQTGCRGQGHRCAVGSCCSGYECRHVNPGEPQCELPEWQMEEANAQRVAGMLKSGQISQRQAFELTANSIAKATGNPRPYPNWDRPPCRAAGHRCAAGSCCGTQECVHTNAGLEPKCMPPGWCAKNQDLCKGVGGFGKDCINENEPCNVGVRSCCGMMMCDKVRGRSQDFGHHCVWPEDYEKDNCLKNPDMPHCGQGFGHPFAKMWDGIKDIGKETVKLDKEVVKDTAKLGKDVGDFTLHPIKSTIKEDKATGKKTVKLGKEVIKGTAKLGKDIVKGAMNLNKDVMKFERHPIKTTINATKDIGKDVAEFGKSIGTDIVKAAKHPVKAAVNVHKFLRHRITHPIQDIRSDAKAVKGLAELVIDKPILAAAVIAASVASDGLIDEEYVADELAPETPDAPVTPDGPVPDDPVPETPPDADPCPPGSRRLLGDGPVECILPEKKFRPEHLEPFSPESPNKWEKDWKDVEEDISDDEPVPARGFFSKIREFFRKLFRLDPVDPEPEPEPDADPCPPGSRKLLGDGPVELVYTW